MSSRLTAEGLCLDEYSANDAYAAVHFKRAVGELPEMESAKAMARLVTDRIEPEQSLLDVGCGAGHYLRSYKKTIAEPFRYVGVDYYSIFLDNARKAWADEPIAEFRQGSIFDLPVKDREFDIVTSSNLLMHLPSIVKPLGELIRAARKWVLVRTMIGERSFLFRKCCRSRLGPIQMFGWKKSSMITASRGLSRTKTSIRRSISARLFAGTLPTRRLPTSTTTSSNPKTFNNPPTPRGCRTPRSSSTASKCSAT